MLQCYCNKQRAQVWMLLLVCCQRRAGLSSAASSGVDAAAGVLPTARGLSSPWCCALCAVRCAVCRGGQLSKHRKKPGVYQALELFADAAANAAHMHNYGKHVRASIGISRALAALAPSESAR